MEEQAMMANSVLQTRAGEAKGGCYAPARLPPASLVPNNAIF